MATLKHNPIEIDKDNPFANCKLQRQPYAEVLTDIVRNYADGFVLAINNEWGTGKTTFVKMWQKHLDKHEFQTLYFNAWENDFEDDVLVALLSELKELKKPATEAVFKEVVKRAAPLAKRLIPILLNAVADKYVGDDIIKKLIEGTAETTAEGLEAELKSYTSRKDSIESFRESLEKFVEAADPDKPVVFILDELDRCRPNYAVRVLEQIKHLFSVPGIVFVLSIDKNQLGHAVRGVYGSESLNADEYLRRFIDLEFTLPDPKPEQYIIYLYNYFGLQDFFENPKRRNLAPFTNNGPIFLDTANLIFKQIKLTLRQQEKIFASTSVVLKSTSYNAFVFPPLFLFLIYLRIHHDHLYQSIRNNEYSLQELLDRVESLFPSQLTDEEKRLLTIIEVFLLGFYNNSNQNNNLTLDPSNPEQVSLSSKFDGSKGDDKLMNNFRFFYNSFDTRSLPLYFLLKRIDLIERFKEVE